MRYLVICCSDDPSLVLHGTVEKDSRCSPYICFFLCQCYYGSWSGKRSFEWSAAVTYSAPIQSKGCATYYHATNTAPTFFQRSPRHRRRSIIVKMNGGPTISARQRGHRTSSPRHLSRVAETKLNRRQAIVLGFGFHSYHTVATLTSVSPETYAAAELRRKTAPIPMSNVVPMRPKGI